MSAPSQILNGILQNLEKKLLFFAFFSSFHPHDAICATVCTPRCPRHARAHMYIQHMITFAAPQRLSLLRSESYLDLPLPAVTSHGLARDFFFSEIYCLLQDSNFKSIIALTADDVCTGKYLSAFNISETSRLLRLKFSHLYHLIARHKNSVYRFYRSLKSSLDLSPRCTVPCRCSHFQFQNDFCK
jgi:hypothetical protein